MTKITVLLDFGGTLDSDGDRWAVQFHRAYESLGGRLPFPEFEAFFKQSDHLLSEWPGITGFNLTEMAHIQATILARILAEPSAPEPNAVAERFATEAKRKITRNCSVLARFGETHRFGLISNFTGNLTACLDELGVRSLFDVVADSGQLGVAKPSPEIFEWARSQMGSELDGEPWMIGDNYTADVRPAAALGWKTCWVAPADASEPIPAVADARVTSLDQLPRAVFTCSV